jgi:hypothetical protein
MPKPSQVIILAEDKHQQSLVVKYLRRVGLEMHAFRLVPTPSGNGSGEQWVREQFPSEVTSYRARRAATKLIAIIDADTRSVQERLRQLDQTLQQSGVRPIDSATEEIARLVPKRNVETWILCLNDRDVNEGTDYKRTNVDWDALTRSGSITLYEWTRPNAQIPARCVPSLGLGVNELRRLNFRDG